MLWICLACSTQYSVDAPCCPHCGSTEYRLSTDPDPDAPAIVGVQGPEIVDLPPGQKVKPSDA